MEKRILNILKDEEYSTSKIASEINRDYYTILKILNKLLLDKKVKKRIKGKYIFWGLK